MFAKTNVLVGKTKNIVYICIDSRPEPPAAQSETPPAGGKRFYHEQKRDPGADQSRARSDADPLGQGRGVRQRVARGDAEPRPAYNTVSTIVRILEKKGVVGYTPVGKSHRYRPLVAKEAYTRSFMNSVMSNFFDNSLSQMVSFFCEKEDLSVRETERILGDRPRGDREEKRGRAVAARMAAGFPGLPVVAASRSGPAVSRTLLAYLLHRTAVSFVPARFTGLYFLHLHLCKHIFTNTTSLFNLSSDTPDRPP